MESQNGLRWKGPQCSSSSNPLLCSGSPTSRPGCPEPHPAWPWMHPEMGHPQPPWAICSSEQVDQNPKWIYKIHFVDSFFSKNCCFQIAGKNRKARWLPAQFWCSLPFLSPWSYSQGTCRELLAGEESACPDHGKEIGTGWSMRSIPTQDIIWFYVLNLDEPWVSKSGLVNNAFLSTRIRTSS